MVAKYTLIIGEAGTGKTTYASEIVKKCIEDGKSYIVLSITHAAVLNFYNKCQGADKDCFRTVHSFFRINFRNKNALGPHSIPETIIIDEFSLITPAIFKIINYFIVKKAFEDVNVYLIGDPLQLNPVYEDYDARISTIMGYDEKILEKYGFQPTISECRYLFFNTFFALRKYDFDRVLLRTVYRHNDVVLSTLEALRREDKEFPYKFLSIQQVVLKIKQGSYFLASTYKNLQNMYKDYNLINNNKDCLKLFQRHPLGSNGFNTLYLSEGDRIITLSNTSSYFNGQEFKFVKESDKKLLCESDNGSLVSISKEEGMYYPIGPAQFLTIHKAQGRTLKSVIVCIDNLWEINMLYTAVTRASEEVFFYSENGLGVEDLIKVMHNNKLNNLRKILYTDEKGTLNYQEEQKY